MLDAIQKLNKNFFDKTNQKDQIPYKISEVNLHVSFIFNYHNFGTFEKVNKIGFPILISNPM